MGYVLVNEKGNYFTLDNGHLVKRIELATQFTTEIKAKNNINNMPKILRKYQWHIKEYNAPVIEIKREPKSHAITSEYLLNKVEEIERINQPFILELENRFLDLSSTLSTLDLMEVDIKHKIEQDKRASACHGYKMFKLLQDTLIKRRTVKNEMRQIQIVLNGTMSGLTSKEITSQLLSIKELRYTPRVLSELFT